MINDNVDDYANEVMVVMVVLATVMIIMMMCNVYICGDGYVGGGEDFDDFNNGRDDDYSGCVGHKYGDVGDGGDGY